MTDEERGRSPTDAFEQALVSGQVGTYLLRLFVTGTTPASLRAIANLKALCESELNGRYQLEVIDLYQQPELARGEQIVVTPTLIKQLPLPFRRIIGDLSDTERVLTGLDLKRKSIEQDRPES